METTMSKDYLAQLLTNMQSQLDRIEDKTDTLSSAVSAIKQQSQANSDGLAVAQKDIKHLERAKGKKMSLEPRTLYLIALASVIILLIVASILGINLGGLLG